MKIKHLLTLFPDLMNFVHVFVLQLKQGRGYFFIKCATLMCHIGKIPTSSLNKYLIKKVNLFFEIPKKDVACATDSIKLSVALAYGDFSMWHGFGKLNTKVV